MVENLNPTKVGPERRSPDIDDVGTQSLADVNDNAVAINAVLAVLRKAGFLQG